MQRAQKTKLVESLHAGFTTAKAVVITHYTGLTVADSDAIRISMRDSTAQFRITKNRLARLALKGTQFEGLADQFTGPTAIGTAQDPVTAAKILVDFAKQTGKLAIVSGAISGDAGSQTLNADEVKALAALPSLPELRARLVGLLTAPQAKLARIAQAPASQLARMAQARGEQAS